MSERVAASVLVSLVGGILVGLTLNSGPTGADRAIFVWLLAVICCGAASGETEGESVGKLSRRAVAPALILSLTPVLFFYFQFVIAAIKSPESLRAELPWQNVSIHPLSPQVIGVLVFLWLFCFIGSLLFIAVAIAASRLMLAGARSLYGFGPEAVDRVRLTVLAIGGLLAAVLSAMSVLTK